MTNPVRRPDEITVPIEPAAPVPELTTDQTDELLMKLRLEGPDPNRSRLPDTELDDLDIIKGSAQFGEDGLGSTLST